MNAQNMQSSKQSDRINEWLRSVIVKQDKLSKSCNKLGGLLHAISVFHLLRDTYLASKTDLVLPFFKLLHGVNRVVKIMSGMAR